MNLHGESVTEVDQPDFCGVKVIVADVRLKLPYGRGGPYSK
jgi:hypothetical protein